jgi:hypothetical protein
LIDPNSLSWISVTALTGHDFEDAICITEGELSKWAFYARYIRGATIIPAKNIYNLFSLISIDITEMIDATFKISKRRKACAEKRDAAAKKLVDQSNKTYEAAVEWREENISLNGLKNVLIFFAGGHTETWRGWSFLAFTFLCYAFVILFTAGLIQHFIFTPAVNSVVNTTAVAVAAWADTYEGVVEGGTLIFHTS